MLGTIVAQAIPIMILPYFTKILTSDVIGIYLLWLSVSAMLISVGSLAFDQAMFVSKTLEELMSTFRALFILCGLLFIIFLVSYFLLDDLFQINFMPESVRNYIIPLLLYSYSFVLMSGLISYLVYHSKFTEVSIIKIFIALPVGLFQCLTVWLGYGIEGLIYSQSIITFFVVILCLKKNSTYPFVRVTNGSVLTAARKCKKFILLSTPATAINTFSGQLPMILIASNFGLAAAGLYGLANKMLTVPSTLLSGSIMTVFKDEAGVEYRETGQCLKAYFKTFKMLILISIIPFFILFFTAEKIFVLVFGIEWAVSGYYAKILMPFVFFGFVASPLSYTLLLAQWQTRNLIWQLMLLLSTILIFSLQFKVEETLFLYSLCYSFFYIVYLGLSYLAAKGSHNFKVL